MFADTGAKKGAMASTSAFQALEAACKQKLIIYFSRFTIDPGHEKGRSTVSSEMLPVSGPLLSTGARINGQTRKVDNQLLLAKSSANARFFAFLEMFADTGAKKRAMASTINTGHATLSHTLHTPCTHPPHALHTPSIRPQHALHIPSSHTPHTLHTPVHAS